MTALPIRVSTEPVFDSLIDIRPDTDGVPVMRAAAGLSVDLLDNGSIRSTSVLFNTWIETAPEGCILLTMYDGSEWVSHNWWDLQFIVRARDLERWP